MSQSDAHRQLVLNVAEALRCRCPLIRLVTDTQSTPGEPIPPIISGYRPDVFAMVSSSETSIIAEAKTDNDLENKHTNNQIAAFINYLEQKKNGLFVLSVSGNRADRAKTMLRFIVRNRQKTNTSVAVFDGCDFWFIDSFGGRMWHLS